MKKRVLVGMSGGVDSSVTAYLLQQQGYDVVAGFMKNFADPDNPNCHTKQDRDMAIKVSQYLGIKTFMIFDFRKEYEERIINYIYEGYQKGITPNPDVLCNNLVKFDLFLEEAMKLGFDYIAMGHYAKVIQTQTEYELHRGVDRNKDQSYFLSGLNQYQLSKSLLPLGNLHKHEVREIAEKVGLPNAHRKDSQGLCFIGKTSMKDFLMKKLPIKEGNIIDTNGNIVGKHDGAYFFTLGQSRGLDINIKAYVIATNIETNTVTVSYEKHDENLSTNSVQVKARHRIGSLPTLPLLCQVKIRYRQEIPQEAVITKINDTTMHIKFAEQQRATTPGQVVVVYQGEQVLANGIIE